MTGHLVSARDEAGLAARLEALVEDARTAQAHGRGRARAARSDYSWDHDPLRPSRTATGRCCARPAPNSMAADPLIWILSRGRKGDLDQMLALARATGWPFEVKRLAFTGPGDPRALILLLKRGDSGSPPWPDLVLCAEASPSVIARAIKRNRARPHARRLPRPARGLGARFRSRHHHRAIPHPGLPATWSNSRCRSPPQPAAYRQPAHRRAHRAARRRPGLPRPPRWRGGGTSGSRGHGLCRSGRTGSSAYRRARARRTRPSPRLSARSRRPIGSASSARARTATRHVLAEASEIVVTSNSVSMLSDALASGKPVSVYPLPQSRNLKWRAGEWLYRNAVEAPSPLLAPVRWLFDAGLIEAAADRQAAPCPAGRPKAAGLVRRGIRCRRSPAPCAATSRWPSSLCVH